MTPKEILLTAADLIEKHGHCKFQYEDDAGRMCIHGAIHKAQTGDATEPGPLDKIVRAELGHYLKIKQMIPREYDITPGFSAAFWNNEPTVNDTAVISILRGTAEGLS